MRRIVIGMLTFLLATQVQAQHAIIQSSAKNPMEIYVYRGYGMGRDLDGRLFEDGTVAYEMVMSASGHTLRRWLGCRGNYPYYDRELKTRKTSLYLHARSIAVLDIAGLVGGLCLALGPRCLTILGFPTGRVLVEKNVGLAHITNLMARFTGLTLIGSIVTGVIVGLTNFLNPYRRWDKADAITVVWQFRGDGSPTHPEYEYRPDIDKFADMISEGLCEIDRKNRQKATRLLGS